MLSDPKGSVVVLTALAVDVANIYLNITQVSNMADAAVLAGAIDLANSPSQAFHQPSIMHIKTG